MLKDLAIENTRRGKQILGEGRLSNEDLGIDALGHMGTMARSSKLFKL